MSDTMRPDKIKLCIACGHYHGSVNEGFRCLEKHIAQQRAELEPLAELRAAIRKLPKGWYERLTGKTSGRL
jgi:hypothetical protein